MCQFLRSTNTARKKRFAWIKFRENPTTVRVLKRGVDPDEISHRKTRQKEKAWIGEPEKNARGSTWIPFTFSLRWKPASEHISRCTKYRVRGEARHKVRGWKTGGVELVYWARLFVVFRFARTCFRCATYFGSFLRRGTKPSPLCLRGSAYIWVAMRVGKTFSSRKIASAVVKHMLFFSFVLYMWCVNVRWYLIV